RKAIASLRPIIDTVQGTVTAEAAAETIAAIFATPEAQATIEQRMPTGQWAPAAQAPVAASRAARVLRRDSGNVHLALFIFLFLDAVIRLAGIVYPPLANYPLMLIMTLVLLCLIVAALVRQHRSDMSSPLRNTVWSLFVYACFLAVAIYIYEVMNQMEWQFGMQGQDVELARPRQILMMVVNTVASVCDLIFGSIGLVFLRSYLVSFRGVEAAKSES
ncbi:MAG: hypothetical protein K1Y02_21395, partial [Candidatus Hydrogenedentes bacterium]|nr:hypothetical protein [Candidatus Hydrogenedentota bacterium]